jgi:hypothetical protein
LSRVPLQRRARWRAFFSFALALGVHHVAMASDRPYLAATNAVADEDDDRVVALETWVESSHRFREFRFEPEYNFDPRNAVRFELGINEDRRFEPSLRARSAEVEVKHLFTDLARSGWGSGVIVGVDRDIRKGNDDPSQSSWSVGAAGLLSLRPTPDTLAHFNLGAVKASDTGGRLRWAVAIEHEIVRRTSLFVEAGAVADEERIVHGGVRHWVKRERFAIDLTMGRRRGELGDRTFVTLGIALQDLSW